MQKSLSLHCQDYPQPRMIFARLTHRITLKNSAYWQIKPLDFSLTLVLFKFPDVSPPAILLSPNSFDSLEPVHEVKDLVVTLEKRTISYLSVSARIRVIDPFSQMKREYDTIFDDADSANRNNFVPAQSFTWCSPGNFSQGDRYLKVNC